MIVPWHTTHPVHHQVALLHRSTMILPWISTVIRSGDDDRRYRTITITCIRYSPTDCAHHVTHAHTSLLVRMYRKLKGNRSRLGDSLQNIQTMIVYNDQFRKRNWRCHFCRSNDMPYFVTMILPGISNTSRSQARLIRCAK